MTMLRNAVIGLLALFGVLATPAHAEWRRAESQHFIAFGQMSDSDLRTRLERLEKFDAMMRQLFNVEDTVKVHLFLLPSMGDVQEYANDSGVGGFYNATAQLAYAFMPEKLSFYRQGFTPESILLHEYTHHMLLGGLDVYVPGWATEGLAEMFSTVRYDSDGGLTIGAPNPARSQFVYSGSRWNVEKLLRSDKDRPTGDERIELYSRGWALAHYLWLSGKRPGQYSKFLACLNDSGEPVECGKKVFGDLDKLDREVNAYLRRSTFPASSFSEEQLDAPTDITVRDATPGEEAILHYRMVSLLGVNKETAPKLAADARPVGAKYPNDAFVQRAMAEIEYDAASVGEGGDFGLADAAADRALAADPENVMAMAYKGRIAAQRAMKSDEPAGYWDEARKWFLKANKLEPNNPLPFVLYYDSFIAERGEAPEGAVGGLYRAIVLMPQDPSLRARAAVELIKSDDIAKAREVLAPAAFSPHAAPENPMRKLIDQIDEDKSPTELEGWIEDEKFDVRFNDFLGNQVNEELAEKEKKKEGES